MNQKILDVGVLNLEDFEEIFDIKEFDVTEIQIFTLEGFEVFDASDIQLFSLDDIEEFNVEEIKPFF